MEFLGSSLKDLLAFPSSARREAGFQLDRVQRNEEPVDWKPMSDIGAGVRELRIRDDGGAFRVVYVASLKDAVYVLHCFEKRSAKTSKTDIDLAVRRYREWVREK